MKSVRDGRHNKVTIPRNDVDIEEFLEVLKVYSKLDIITLTGVHLVAYSWVSKDTEISNGIRKRIMEKHTKKR